MAYEKKFEKYMISELEKMLHDKDNPVFRREDFDLAITHPDKSYNKRAMKMLEDAFKQHVKDVLEGTTGPVGLEYMKVPDHEDIERKRLEDEATVDCDDIEIHIIKKVYDRVANGASYVSVPELGSTLLKADETLPILGKMC